MSALLPDPEKLVAEMAEKMRGTLAKDAALVGIYTGGAWVAERLNRLLAPGAPLGLLAVTLHRDDFGRIGLHRESRRSQIPFPVGGRELPVSADYLGAKIDLGRDEDLVLSNENGRLRFAAVKRPA